MTPSHREIDSQDARLELVSRIVGLLDRTFAAEEHQGRLEALRRGLLTLDLPALGGFLRGLGIEAAEEIDEPARDQ